MLNLTQAQARSSRSTASSGCWSSTAASRPRWASRPRTSSSSRTASRIEFFPDGRIRRGTPIEAGRVFVDGLSVGEVGDVVLRDRRALANDGMFLIVVTVDKQTGSLVGTPGDRDPRLRGRPPSRRSSRAPRSGSPRSSQGPGDRPQRDRPAQGEDQGQPLAVPVRPDATASDGAAGGGRGLMADRQGGAAAPRRPRPRTASRRARKPSPSSPRTRARAAHRAGHPALDRGHRAPGPGRHHPARRCSCGGQGLFGEFVTDVLRPSFGQGAWLLGVLLIVAGVMVERWRHASSSGWVVLTLGGLLVFVAGEGLIHLLSGRGASADDLSLGGGGHRPRVSSTPDRPRRVGGRVPGARWGCRRGHPAAVRA